MKKPAPKTAPVAPKAAAEPAAKVSYMPTLGRILHYRVTADNAAVINASRDNAGHIHTGSAVGAGDQLPLIVTKVLGDTFRGQLFLDGNDTFWVDTTTIGENEGQCSWPATPPTNTTNR